MLGSIPRSPTSFLNYYMISMAKCPAPGALRLLLCNRIDAACPADFDLTPRNPILIPQNISGRGERTSLIVLRQGSAPIAVLIETATNEIL